MDLRNFSGIELMNFYFTTVQKLFWKIFIRSGKCIMCNSIQVFQNQASKKSIYMFEDIELRETHTKLHKTPSETLGAD